MAQKLTGELGLLVIATANARTTDQGRPHRVFTTGSKSDADGSDSWGL